MGVPEAYTPRFEILVPLPHFSKYKNLFQIHKFLNIDTINSISPPEIFPKI